MKCLGLIFLLAASLSLCGADEINPNIKGVLIIGKAGHVDQYLRTYAENGDYPFTDISWYSALGGYITGADGKQIQFSSSSISQIVYFDQVFKGNVEIKNDVFIAELKPCEVLATIAYGEILTADEASAVQDSKDKLVKANSTTLKPYVDLLDGYVSKFKEGQRYVEGKWLRLAEDRANHVYGPVTFNCGTSQYENAYVVLGSPIYVLTTNGGAPLSIGDINLPDDTTKLPNEFVEPVVESHLAALEATADANQIADFLPRVEALGLQSQKILSVQEQLADFVTATVTKGICEASTRKVILQEWPHLKKAIRFTPEQQIDFYKKLIEGCDLSTNECKDVLAMASSPDSPVELKSIVATWTDQISAADRLAGQMEGILGATFAAPANRLLLQTTETQDELAKPITL